MARSGHDGISDISKSVLHRLDDARALLNAGRWRGAMYVGGYVIECLLKSKLMQVFRCQNLHELEQELHRRRILAAAASVYTHQLLRLLRLAGGLERMTAQAAVRTKFNLVNGWMPAWRYSSDLGKREDAEDFLQAVETVRQWITNNI